MLDNIISASLDIVQRVERLIGMTRGLIASGRLDESETYDLYCEIEQITDVVLTIDEAVRRLRQLFDVRPEMARRFTIHATLQ
jgi:gamma-glutamyl:cysteine ligase YbdK (ATP-grasp superfamily)